VEASLAAYFRSGGFDQPTVGGVVQEYEGKLHVVLSNVRGTLAVYRVRNDGMLRGCVSHLAARPRLVRTRLTHQRLDRLN